MFKTFKENTTEIKDIEGLLKGKVPGKVIKHEVRPLTAFGENFGSEMLRVDITIEENGEEKNLHAVGKLIPPTEMQLEVFNTQVTFKNEMILLADIAPLLKDFQREYRFSEIADYFPKIYGARYNLNPNSHEVDLDAVILMENLAIEGYANLDRFEGFDLDSAKQVLRVLANFQATAVGLKLKKPDVFASKIRPYLTEFVFPIMGEAGNKDPLFLQTGPYLIEHPSTVNLVPRFKKFLAKSRIKRVKKTREPWATIVHNDLWVNNIMVKQTNHHVSEIKLVDFQIIDYGSPIADLAFFLFTSVQTPVLKYHFEKLILFYYNEFVKTLQHFNVDLKEFSYESFQEELKLEINLQLYHSLFMLNVVFGPKGMPKNPGKVAEWNPNKQVNALSNGNSSLSSHAGPPGSHGPGRHGGPGSPDDPKTPGDHAQDGPPIFPWPTTCKEKLWFMIEEAAKRNWI